MSCAMIDFFRFIFSMALAFVFVLCIFWGAFFLIFWGFQVIKALWQIL